MTEREELLRRALLREQAATLSRQDANRHDSEVMPEPVDGEKPALSELTIRIQFYRETLTPMAIFYDNAETDVEQAKLREIADIMLKALPDREAAPLEEINDKKTD